MQWWYLMPTNAKDEGKYDEHDNRHIYHHHHHHHHHHDNHDNLMMQRWWCRGRGRIRGASTPWLRHEMFAAGFSARMSAASTWTAWEWGGGLWWWWISWIWLILLDFGAWLTPMNFDEPEDPDDGKELKDVGVLHVGGNMGQHLRFIFFSARFFILLYSQLYVSLSMVIQHNKLCMTFAPKT